VVREAARGAAKEGEVAARGGKAADAAAAPSQAQARAAIVFAHSAGEKWLTRPGSVVLTWPALSAAPRWFASSLQIAQNECRNW
jgi:hypothetical protein